MRRSISFTCRDLRRGARTGGVDGEAEPSESESSKTGNGSAEGAVSASAFVTVIGRPVEDDGRVLEEEQAVDIATHT